MEKPHIAVVPSPGFTHLVPILEFSKRLVHLHPQFYVTCIIPSVGSPPTSSKAYLQTLPSSITSIFLPPISLGQVPDATVLAAQIELSVFHSLPYIKEELKSLCSRTRVVALVVDVFANQALDFAREFNLLSYIYLPQAAMVLSTYFYSSKLDEILSSESRDPQEPIKIPGCVPFHYKDLPLPFQFRSGIGYKRFLERAKQFHSPDGVFVNSFLELEAGAIGDLQEEQIRGKPKVYPVGPIIQSGSIGQENGLECLTWLDKQEPKSVLYVSFGSGGTLSQEQFNELAFGLELSGQKFLWVVRAPSGVSSAAYLGGDGAGEDPLQFLPHGFLERTKKQGLVVPSWVPQIQVLGHSSTGGFLSHCGWNSVLESVVQGVPIIAWPLFAEQSMNTVMLTDGLKVALRPKVNGGGLAEREEVAKVVRGLMEGEEGIEIRKRMEHLKNAAANAIKEGGSSTETLSEVVASVPSHPHQSQEPSSVASEVVPASFHNSASLNNYGFYYGLEAESVGSYSTLPIMPLKSDCSLYGMEALSRSQTQVMPTTPAPKLENFLGSEAMGTPHYACSATETMPLSLDSMLYNQPSRCDPNNPNYQNQVPNMAEDGVPGLKNWVGKNFPAASHAQESKMIVHVEENVG
ncbi:UDP-glycosyltransferase family, conserved site [Sesbania bispinosa]|nr:UDP-glycosyltransferase family, conserved site [Sesbania bispinosa]